MSDVFFKLHRGLPQQGPGSDASTSRAFKLLPLLGDRPRILDIGCGPGRQSLVLARESGGTVVAVDTNEAFLDELGQRAQEAGLAGTIERVRASMDSLAFEPGSFDVVWSEGAAYIMGFEKALRSWVRLLKSEGFLAVSEVCWLKPDPPSELKVFWEAAYPAMKGLDENLRLVQQCGYRELGKFTLPESDWWDGYYRPIEERLHEFRRRYSSDSQALKALDEEQDEIDLYRRFSDWYGYVFFVAQRG